MQSSPHAIYMHHAIRLAAQQLGNTGARPSVGCVLVKNSQIIGTGCTGPDGYPHAEAAALASAGNHAQGATAYVTLEPCSHHGRTPPCADALIEAGIAHVVIACSDPDSRVGGQGIEKLRHKGLIVDLGVAAEPATEQMMGYLRWQKYGLPFVTLKLATSLDNKIATANGESQWITGEQARNLGHQLRASHDAILTGIGTVLTDNPTLTCRLPELENRSPIRVILDSKLRIPLDSKLVQTAKNHPIWIITQNGKDAKKVTHLRNAGAEVFRIRTTEHLRDILALLGAEGVTRVLVEGGKKLSTAFLRRQLVDELYLFRAPTLIGDDGISAFDALGTGEPTEAIHGACIHQQSLGKDTLSVYKLATCLPAL